MIREIVRDPIFLTLPSEEAAAADIPTADDLRDTLRAHLDGCVGMAANMIGVSKRIIVYVDNGKIEEMFNPRLLSGKKPYAVEEGCLSLDGTRPTKRYESIRVEWQNRLGQKRIKNFTGFTAEIIQHELDHLEGILI